jgi:hypothetical protein
MPTITPNGYPYPIGSDELGETDLHIRSLAEKIEADFHPAYTDVTFNGAWTNFGAPYEEASYAKVGSIVRLRGSVKHATTSTTGTIFTLPAGYRPTKQRIYLVPANAGFAFIAVATTGVVSVNSYGASGNAGIIALDVINFDVAA